MGKKKIYNIEEMVKKIDEYLENGWETVPIVKECCRLNGWSYNTIEKYQRENEKLKEAIQKIINRKEEELEKGGLTGKFNNTFAIFSLKQLGWRDKIEHEIGKKDEHDDIVKAIKKAIKK